jgi:DNA replication and repair protein RecF
VALTRLTLRHVRNIEAAEIEPDTGLNLIVGGNGAGKSSLIEAIYFLSRAKSYRPSGRQGLIREGAEAARIIGHVLSAEGNTVVLGAEKQRNALTLRIAGRPATGVAELTTCLPVQLLHPQSHDLLEGGPRTRRRYLDWGVFHVEHTFFPAWRRFQRALRQRNQALRNRSAHAVLVSWDQELDVHAQILHTCRARYAEQLGAVLPESCATLLPSFKPELRYQPGWDVGHPYHEQLAAEIRDDLRYGQTRSGPQRADIALRIRGRPAHELLSRGEQKLLVAAMVFTQATLFRELTGRASVLLVDDLAAELDHVHRARLLESICAMQAQSFVTTTERESLGKLPMARLFHVEQGCFRAA